MDESKKPDSASLPRPSNADVNKQKSSWPFTLFVTVLVPVVAATMLYQLDSFDPAPLPPSELNSHVITVPTRSDQLLRVSEFVGMGNLIGPEDIAYDAKSGVIYTGCHDGWISRVTVNDSAADSVVEKWVNSGGRLLGIAFGHNNELIVADSEKVSIHLFSICNFVRSLTCFPIYFLKFYLFHVYLFVQYWQSRLALWDIAFRHPFIRKFLIIMEKYNRRPRMEKGSGVMVIDLAGNPIAHYYDPILSLISSAMKIKKLFVLWFSLLSLHSSPQPEGIS
ncbi:protein STRICTOSIDINE SYNTHASE-LIKE 5-like [Castanea sativa]|uniref:protein STRICTOSIDINE SYNTHASE-LIKE 5-like n=1 Tax=Castanea sativa TaxID=21020 RepID=UPI003F64AE73